MATDPKTKLLSTGRLGRFATMVRTGAGTASSLLLGSEGGIEKAVDRLADLRGLGTKVGQMAGLVEASLSPELRARVGPALAKLRDQAARSPYADVARMIEEDLGAPPLEFFATFEETPFASASLGQVHRATLADGRALAVKIQHPGIGEAFTNDLQNVTALGRVATTFVMPRDDRDVFIDGVKATFLAELDYLREAEDLKRFARLLEHDDTLELPVVIDDRTSARVLTTTFLEGVPVEEARAFPVEIKRRQAAAIRRLVLSGLADHGLLYADAHAGNFLFRERGTIGVLDFGSVVHFEAAQQEAFAALIDTLAHGSRSDLGPKVQRAFEIQNATAADAIAEVQWQILGPLVRGERITGEDLARVTDASGKMKSKLMRERFSLPWYLPFVMRCTLACAALMATLEAPESGPLTRIP